MSVLDALLDGRLSEGFTMQPITPNETVAQSTSRGAQDVKNAKASLAQGYKSWNASKHPRAGGGKFGYTTGGKRATKGKTQKGNVLTNGSRGQLVASIQRQLGLPADGIYGPQTRAAVMRYQQQHGLRVDGVIGRQTLAALRGHSNPASVKPGPIAAKAARVKAPRVHKPRAVKPRKAPAVKVAPARRVSKSGKPSRSRPRPAPVIPSTGRAGGGRVL